MGIMSEWNANLYDNKHGFVAEYGRDVLGLLHPQKKEDIVDLGCGTGDLTMEIASSGANVIGIDSSVDMLQKARKKYPGITFLKADANTFKLLKSYHAVFSNAALHWIKTPVKVSESVYNALYPGGRFVAEFGGKGNVEVLINGILEVLINEYNMAEQEAMGRIPWYFPSIGEYSQLLETTGFRVIYANHFNRPTTLSDGEQGLNHWLESFADNFFPEVLKEERTEIYERVKENTKTKLFKGGNWIIDYKRLRIVAIK